jgi:hypothetical protein
MGGSREADEFVEDLVQQIQVPKLVPADGSNGNDGGRAELACVVELWQPRNQQKISDKIESELIETRTPLRLGKQLRLIPFVFHGPCHSLPTVAKPLHYFQCTAQPRPGIVSDLPLNWTSIGSSLKFSTTRLPSLKR